MIQNWLDTCFRHSEWDLLWDDGKVSVKSSISKKIRLRLNKTYTIRKLCFTTNLYRTRLNPVKKQARLDFFIVSEGIFQLVTESSIVSGYRTDHSGISLKIKFQDAERGRGYWKFNNSLLKDKDYIKIVKDAIEETKDIYANNNNTLGVNINNQYIIDDQLLLETLLFTIRGETIKYSSRKKRETLQEERKLEEEIELLEENWNDNLLTIDNHEILLLEEKK